MNNAMRLTKGGFTLVEVIAASVVVVVIIGGMMAAFITAARIVKENDTFAFAEAAGYARQTADHFRNSVASDLSTLPGLVGAGWQLDPLPASSSLPGNAKRCFKLESACGGDCYEMQATICWNNHVGCPC